MIFEFVNYAEQNKIVLHYLSVYCTHRLQQLDVEIFDLLATVYLQLVNEYNRYQGIDITKRVWTK
jgi:hypothetical protein